MSPASRKFFFPTALTPQGWATDVLVTVADGVITAVDSSAAAPDDAIRHDGVALPGTGDLHSHAFQRAMAGLAERGGDPDDDFWSWRDVMYRFLGVLSPDDIEAITALAFMEMLEAGFTGIAEFHYLHNDPHGQNYADPAELAGRIVAAAATTGIGLTLLPVFYAHGGFGGMAPRPGQRRFITDLDRFARLHEASGKLIAGLPDARLGVAPHSLRAVTPAELEALVGLAGPSVIHIHVAEQQREVADCVAALGARPVAWLLDHAPVDTRWCLVHATHLTSAECLAMARSGAVAGLCPVTEANLGDGIFPLVDYLDAGGRIGIGTDSNVAIMLAQELRQLEYSQRLRDLRRCRLATPEISTGRRLFELASAGGAQVLDRRIGSLAPGARADFVVLDPDHPALVGRSGDTLLDSWIFATSDRAVDTVYVGGRLVVAEGHHVARDAILDRWRRCADRLRDAL